VAALRKKEKGRKNLTRKRGDLVLLLIPEGGGRNTVRKSTGLSQLTDKERGGDKDRAVSIFQRRGRTIKRVVTLSAFDGR